MHTRAKALVKKNPRRTYQSALKEAGKEMRASGKKKPAKKKAVAKKKVGAKYKVYHEVKKVGKLSYKGGSVSLGSLTIAQAKHKVDEKLAWEMLAKSSAKTKKDRNALQKSITELKRKKSQLNAL